MERKTWVYVALVGVITLGVLIFGIVKFVGSKNTDELVDDGDTVRVDEREEVPEEEEPEGNNEQVVDNEENTGDANKEKEQENVRLLEEKLGLTEGTLVSKEELERQIEEWIEDGEVYGVLLKKA